MRNKKARAVGRKARHVTDKRACGREGPGKPKMLVGREGMGVEMWG